MNIIISALGRYEVNGKPDDADVVVGHSFGTLIGEGSANRAIADFALQAANGRPIVADRMLVNAFPNSGEDVDHVVEGPISNGVGQGVGSWGTLVAAKAFMEREGLSSALMVGQAHHIGRVAMQAKRLGIHSIIPANLPNRFDPESEQRWTRSLGMWLPREVVGSLVLRLQNKL
ncbi:hypothetical protein IPL85_01540 [Candidatus Saccharibacteria bacterium]|nr:MAG: hypothetical protein IPL85_01540 [Candidatus Saccharibacteria bacterium]